MYAKLFSRITESSLMEEEIPVRYTFVMLLAIADPKGYVIGTDIAIARRLNMPLAQCAECLKELGEPDPDSNSKAEEGRRLIPSDCERGYKIVNYESYRDVRDEDQRREYMRDYMRDYRKRDVNTVNNGKHELAEAEADGEAKGEAQPPKGVTEGKRNDRIPSTDQSKRFAAIFHRRETSAWTEKEIKAYKRLGTVPLEDLAAVEKYYATNWPPRRDVNILRHDLVTFLNNFSGEVDRAYAAAPKSKSSKPVVAYQAHSSI